MAVTIKRAPNKFVAILIGAVLASGGLFFGMRTVFTRAIDEEPQAVAVSEITPTSAVITWETGQEVQGAVKYGKGPAAADLTSIGPETERTKTHKVELNLLEAGTTYYFKIIGGTDTEYTNAGSPWTFTTTTDEGSIPTSNSGVRTVSPIQRLVIGASPTPQPSTTPSVNCATEANCDLIKANFTKGCSTSDYIKCRNRITR